MRALLWLAIAAGVVLRLLALAAHDHPRGDVQLDVGVARSLASGQGFASGFERGLALVEGDRPVPPVDRADQHAPLWPVVGAALSFVGGSAFGGLKLASLLLGLWLLALVWREADRLVEPANGAPDGLPAVATAAVALCFLTIDASGSGSLSIALAVLSVLLVRQLGAPRPSGAALGLLLGAAWLLAHQAVLLLAVPLAVLLLAPPPGGRRAALRTGLLAAGIAVALHAPWWWRNARVFGEAGYDVNGIYLLYSAGVEPVFSIEGGWPVARFTPPEGWGWLLRAARSWIPPNALYLLVTGLIAWPGLIAIVGSGALPLLAARGGPRSQGTTERRQLAALLLLAAFAAIALLWPGTKLRYLVPMTPLVALLGARILALPPSRGEQRLAWLVAAAWIAALALTLNEDMLVPSEASRPERWSLLAAGGALMLLAPLLLRARRAGGRPLVAPRLVGSGLRLAFVTGLAFMPLLAAAALAPPPHTAYHSTKLTPDVFGNAKEVEEARQAEAAARARASALERGARKVAAGMEWLAWEEPELVTVPRSTGDAARDDAALAALLESCGADHVFVLSGQGWPEALEAGDTWLGGRLEVVEAFPPNDAAKAGTLSRVRPPR